MACRARGGYSSGIKKTLFQDTRELHRRCRGFGRFAGRSGHRLRDAGRRRVLQLLAVVAGLLGRRQHPPWSPPGGPPPLSSAVPPQCSHRPAGLDWRRRGWRAGRLDWRRRRRWWRSSRRSLTGQARRFAGAGGSAADAAPDATPGAALHQGRRLGRVRQRQEQGEQVSIRQEWKRWILGTPWELGKCTRSLGGLQGQAGRLQREPGRSRARQQEGVGEPGGSPVIQRR
jgi:hypothetical protein